MVKSVKKNKNKTKAANASVKKAVSKVKKEDKMKNGYGDSTDEQIENQTEAEPMEISKSVKKVDVISEIESRNISTNNSEKLVEATTSSSDVDVSKKSRKRKETAAVEEKVTRIKTKKQKALLELPKISSISGKVFVIGENDVGQLGLGEDVVEKKRPVILELPYSVVDIAAGGMHSVCLTESGEVITFGCNDEGALGRLTSDDGSEYIPLKVDIAEHIVQISAGDSHSAALSESGQVYIWGNFRNINGPMGLVTDYAKQITPVKILSDHVIVQIASGSEHLVCLSQEGIVYTCGCGEAGQLGRVVEHASVDGGRKGTDFLRKPAKVLISQSDKSGLASNVWSGSYTTFVKIHDSDFIYAFGLNNYNQLGVADQNTIFKPKRLKSFNNKTWVQIDGGQHHTLALDNNGIVYALGRSEYGRLGLGENSEVMSVPTAIPLFQEEKCVQISCGNCVSFAITDNGSLYSWGMGTSHQLGHGDDNDQHVPRLIEGNFFNTWKAIKVAGGGQHTLILAHRRESLEKGQ